MKKSRKFLLQMAGTSGVGKSTLAKRIAEQSGAIVIDMDVIKSAALEAGTNWDMSGRVGYRASHAIAESLLEQGLSVILDSPCRFEFIVEGGMAIAQKSNVPYAFIDCILTDEDELRKRMNTRKRQRSQRVAFDQRPSDAPIDVMKDETGKIIMHKTIVPKSNWLQVDMGESLEQIVDECLNYLNELIENYVKDEFQ
jgi:predicted kinase